MLLQLKKFEFLKFLLILHTKFDIPLLIFQISLPRVRNIRGLNALYYGIFSFLFLAPIYLYYHSIYFYPSSMAFKLKNVHFYVKKLPS